MAEIVAVDGPVGGEFQFWGENSTTEPTLRVPAGINDGNNGNFRFAVSDQSLGAGQPGGDPYGHIHGRRFALSKAGVYTVTLRAVDLSTNGPGNGPVHTPSDPLSVRFQGGVNLVEIVKAPNHVLVIFGAAVGFAWQLESRNDLSRAEWQPIGEPITGNDLVTELKDERPPIATRFYRVRGAPLTSR